MPAVAVFSGSFLLFLTQPLLGRTLLPVFGGTAAVWNVCLAAYQMLLLAGYAYAYGLAKLPMPRQRRIHLVLLAVAAMWAGVVAALRLWLKDSFGTSSVPALEVLFCVLFFIGLPYALLAAGSTLVQSWLVVSGTSQPGRGVYRLYAVSNLGSFLGLLVYPLILEPFVPLTMQWWGFAVCFAGYVVWMSLFARRLRAMTIESPPDRDERSISSIVLWFLLPGVTAFLLNALVSHLFMDVTPMPLIWVAMLSAFLLSYAVGFSPAAANWRGLWCGMSALALTGAAFANGMWGTGSFYPNLAAAMALLFFVGIVAHGWLYAERPGTAQLTHYYLVIAAGGAVGGLLSALVAPMVFDTVLEYPLILFACAILVAWRMPKPPFVACSRSRAWIFVICLGLAWLLLERGTSRHTMSKTVFSERNFYGCLRVTETHEKFGVNEILPIHYLWCGQTTHGIQVRSPKYRRLGTSYYGRTGGGIAFSAHPKYRAHERMTVGVIGLGAGCLACYGRPDDLFRFYEINPQVVKIATNPNLFTFLPDAPMPIDLVLGDARRMLERERAAGDPLYDVLVIDAYNGDAVPYHLATLESYRLYFDRLAPDGILAVHVSNWHVDMLPLCKAMATTLGVVPYGVVGTAENSVTAGAMWVFMTRKPMAYQFQGKSSVREVVWENVRDMTAPTDEKGSLLPLLRLDRIQRK